MNDSCLDTVSLVHVTFLLSIMYFDECFLGARVLIPFEYKPLRERG